MAADGDLVNPTQMYPTTNGWCPSQLQITILGPEIILVRGCENFAGKLRQKW